MHISGRGRYDNRDRRGGYGDRDRYGGGRGGYRDFRRGGPGHYDRRGGGYGGGGYGGGRFAQPPVGNCQKVQRLRSDFKMMILLNDFSQKH